MSVIDVLPTPSPSQHLVLDGVSWASYSGLLRDLERHHLRITFDNGSLEIMSPLPKHERWGALIGRLIELMALERDITVVPFGSTTFRDEERQKGLEPDECYYVQNAAAVQGLEDEFDPTINPAPDLAIEIDVTHSSVPREPVYAALGVRELWRFDGARLVVRVLNENGNYETAAASTVFPFLPIAEFERFVSRSMTEPPNAALREFRDWVRALPAD